MRTIRYGFRLMHRYVPQLMKRYGIKPADHYMANNHHAGVMWGFKKECKGMTNNRAETIIWKLHQTGKMTKPMIESVSKMLAYTFEILGGRPQENFPSVRGAIKAMEWDQGDREVKSTLPERVPTPEQVKQAFTTPWNGKWSLVKHCTAVVATFDTVCCGARSRLDVQKVKDSKHYQADYNDRLFCRHKFDHGRSKLTGDKVGRDWWMWRCCTCPGGKHTRPTPDLQYEIGKDGNPVGGERTQSWWTNCPLACCEFLEKLQEKNNTGRFRPYARWLKSGQLKKQNHGDVIDLVLDWLVSQGVCATRFSTNCGRYAMARLMSQVDAPYDESFEVHGDLYKTYRDHYQHDVPPSSFSNRNQSQNPDIALKALRRIAAYFGGRPIPKVLTTNDVGTMVAALLNKMGEGATVQAILGGSLS